MNDQVDDAVSMEIQDIAAGLKKNKTLQSLKVGQALIDFEQDSHAFIRSQVTVSPLRWELCLSL